MTFLTQRSDKFLAWSSPLRAFWALVSLEAILRQDDSVED